MRSKDSTLSSTGFPFCFPISPSTQLFPKLDNAVPNLPFSSFSRILVVLPFFDRSTACASPVAAPAAAVALPGHGLVAREILIKLKADVDIQLDLLDKCPLETGEKPDAIILKIEGLINTAVAAISKLDIDLLGLLNGKITAIVNLSVYILIVRPTSMNG
ncbi:hypothetical protein OPQ81_011863 [Rhizoctonia solani]|nr:hypothetical protein OPQ81_011863 [Rhizoctonia solani]